MYTSPPPDVTLYSSCWRRKCCFYRPVKWLCSALVILQINEQDRFIFNALKICCINIVTTVYFIVNFNFILSQNFIKSFLILNTQTLIPFWLQNNVVTHSGEPLRIREQLKIVFTSELFQFY